MHSDREPESTEVCGYCYDRISDSIRTSEDGDLDDEWEPIVTPLTGGSNFAVVLVTGESPRSATSPTHPCYI